MPNATERKALILCSFFAGLLCAVPMVGKVALAGASFAGIMKSLGGVLRSLAHPTVLGVWTIGVVLVGLHLVVSQREAKAQQPALPASAPEQPAAPTDAASALPEAPGGA